MQRIVRFTVEQRYLTRGGKPGDHDPAYHLVEADTLDAALEIFLARSSAAVLGEVVKYPGFHGVATARAADDVFTVELMPGSDAYRHAMERRGG